MRTRGPFPALLLGGALLLPACAAPRPPASAPSAAPTPEVQVERVAAVPTAGDPRRDQRGELAVLIGPGNEPVVIRDVRKVALAQGVSKVTLLGMPQDLEVGHLGARAAEGNKALVELLESRPFTGAITPRRLLESSLGKVVTAYVWDPATGVEIAKRATLLGLTDEGPVVSLDGAVRVLAYGRVAVPELPPSLRAEPSAELLVRAQAEVPLLELTYTTRLITAAVEYQLVRPSGAATAELVGLVGVSNETGAALVNADITLTSSASETAKFGAGGASTSPAPSRGVPTTSIHLPAPVSLGHGSRSLTRLFGPRDVELTRKVIFEGRGLPFDAAPDEVGNASVHAVLDARVTGARTEPLSASGMMPGRAHLFERATSAPPHAYGSAVARPLPGAMGLRVDLGDENKFPSKRRLTQKRTLGRCKIETSWEVTLMNPTEEPLPVEDVEPVDGKYELLDSSTPPIAQEEDHFAFGLMIPAQGEVKLKFRVRTTSCVVQRSHYWQPSWGKAAWSPSKGSGS